MISPRCTHGIPSMYSWHPSDVLMTPRCTHGIPPMYWTPPDVLMISLQCTHDIPPMNSWYPPDELMVSPRCTEHPPDVLNISRCTEHTLYRVIIKKHNRAILNKKPTIPQDGCNCREKTRCPLKNKCLATSIIYEVNVTSDSENREQKYIGLTERTFKKRFYGHQLSLKDRKYLKSSELSQHIWKVKDQGRSYRISWKIKNKATPYTNGTKRCDFCLSEKLCILKADKSGLLNKRSELISKCRHQNKFYIKNYKGRVTWTDRTIYKLGVFLLREAWAQPPNLVNLFGAENFRSASLSSRDYVRRMNPSLLVITYLLLLARLKQMCWASGRPSPSCSANINVLFCATEAVRYVGKKNHLCFIKWSMRILLVVAYFVVINFVVITIALLENKHQAWWTTWPEYNFVYFYFDSVLATSLTGTWAKRENFSICHQTYHG